MLETANDPLPSLIYLTWIESSQHVAVTPLLNAINSKKLSSLISIKISCNFGFEVGVLPRAIESRCLPFLEDFKLTGAQGHLALTSVMKDGHLPLLQWLDLVGTSSAQISPTECQTYATAISLGKLQLLRGIDFSWNPDIGNEGVKALAHALQSGGLKIFDSHHLNSCRIDDDGLIAIADSFRAGLGSSVPNLRTLDLSSNDFRDVGLLSLADALKAGHLNSLQNLD